MKLNDATLISLGGTPAKAVYLGNNLVWSATPPDPRGFVDVGEHIAPDVSPMYYIKISGTAAADYSLMLRPGPNPGSDNDYPCIAPAQGGMISFSTLTPIVTTAVAAARPAPVPITKGMTATQIAQAIATTWNGQKSTSHAIGDAITLHVGILPPPFWIRLPAQVAATFGTMNPATDAVIRFSIDKSLTDNYWFEFMQPLVAWRQDASGHWIEYQPNAGTQASGTVVYIDTTGGAVPDPNNVPAGMGAVPVGMKWTWTDAGGQPLAGANMDVEILFGPDANSLTPVGPFTTTLDGNGEYQFNTDIDKGPGRYEYRGKIGSTVVTQVFIGV